MADDKHRLQLFIPDSEPYGRRIERNILTGSYSPPLCPACGSPHHTSYISTMTLSDESRLVSSDLSFKSIEICTCLNCGAVIPRRFSSEREF